ncbi:MAG TPA: hypothetical protein VLD57_07515 [Blastocatellia bacterium]|nr:hypothetical protein [Blastocatellia bacterium]
MFPVTQYKFTEVWKTQEPEDRGGMLASGRIPDICDHNNGKPVEEVGLPPAHPNCYCETAIIVEVVDSD